MSRRGTVVAALLAAVAAVTVVLFYGGAPLITCWTGIGPPPEPATTECVQRGLAALTPYQRLWLDDVWVAAVLLFVAAFGIGFAAMRVISVVGRRVAR